MCLFRTQCRGLKLTWGRCFLYMYIHVLVGEYDFRRLQMRTHIQELSRRPGFPANLVFSEVDCFNDKMMATLRKKVKEQISSAQLRGQKIMGGLVPHSYMVSTVYIGEKTLKRLHIIRLSINHRHFFSTTHY